MTTLILTLLSNSYATNHVNFENFEGLDGNSGINRSIPKSPRI